MAARRRYRRDRSRETEEGRPEVVVSADETKFADALGTIGTPEESSEPQSEEGPDPSPAPASSPPLEGFLEYRRRVKSDTDGYIATAMLEWAATLPDAERERLETDVDFFNSSWDRFEAARPPRPAPAPAPQEPPPPREIRVPEWKRQEIERLSRIKTRIFDSTYVVGPGVMPDETFGSRREAEKYNREVAALRQRVREGDQDAEYLLASKLFPKGLKPND